MQQDLNDQSAPLAPTVPSPQPHLTTSPGDELPPVTLADNFGFGLGSYDSGWEYTDDGHVVASGPEVVIVATQQMVQDAHLAYAIADSYTTFSEYMLSAWSGGLAGWLGGRAGIITGATAGVINTAIEHNEAAVKAALADAIYEDLRAGIDPFTY